ncbi:MAG: BON domain-containing protein [Planctomycetes bacterium]|nr:BON domain-containing protein [Planctomycetota bacterium]
MRKMVFWVLAAAVMVLPAASVMAESPADKAIAQQIGSRLKESGELQNYQIGVKYQDGVAWLSGSVASAEQRDAALRIAREIDGVSHVVCRLDMPSQLPAAIGNSADLHGALQQAGISRTPKRLSGIQQAAARSTSKNTLQRSSQRNPANPQSIRSNGQQRMIRGGNMPLPAQRMAMNPAIRQTSAQGIQPAGGVYTADGSMAGDAMVAGGGSMGVEAVPATFMHRSQGGPAGSYDNANMPAYAWPSYASYPNYAALTYPQQYSPTAWPYIGPFYPYPQVPLGWRKVCLEWDDGWWFLDFSHAGDSH